MPNHFIPIADDAEAIASTFNNPMAQLDAAISTHAHNPGVLNSGGQISHGWLANAGTNTHAQIDQHIGSSNNPHSTNLTQVALLGGSAPQLQIGPDLTEASINDALASTSTIINNFNRMRYSLTTLAGSPWNNIPRSLRVHSHNPTLDGDGGVVVQEGVAYDNARARSRAITPNASIKDNLNEIRADLYDLQQGTGFGTGVITSEHIQNGGLATVDFGNRIITGEKIAIGGVGLTELGPCLVVAQSNDTVKSMVLTILPGVYWPDGKTAVSVNQQTLVYSAAELPAVDEKFRIDSISLNQEGAPIKTVGIPHETAPLAPDVPAGNLPIAQIMWKGVAIGTPVGIYQNAYIPGYNVTTDAYIYKDTRPFLNFGGGSVRVTDEITANAPNGTDKLFSISSTFVRDSTAVTVATNATTAPVRLQRVDTTPGTNQYREGNADGDPPYNVIYLGVAPASGNIVRVSYDTSTGVESGGTDLQYLAIVDQAPATTPNSVLTTFTIADTYVLGSTHVTVAPSLTGTPVTYTRVISSPSTNQYCEGDVTGTGPYNKITFGAAIPTGYIIRVSYFKGDTAPVVNLVWHETPSGTINGTNRVFTTGNPFQSGSLQVYGASSTGGSLTRYQTGTHYNESANLTGFTFTVGNAPAIGSVLVVSYARGDVATNNAQTVGGFAASATVIPGRLLALNGDGKLPASITGDAVTVGEFIPSQTPTGNNIPVLTDGNLTLPGHITLPNNKSIVFTKIAGDPNNNPAIRADTTVNSSRLILNGGTGGLAVRNNADTADLFAVSNTGALTLTSSITVPNNQVTTYAKNTTGNNASVGMTTSEVLQIIAGNGGFIIRDNANANNNFVLSNAGAAAVRGALSATGISTTTLSTSGLATLASGSITGNLAVGGTLTAQGATSGVAGLLSPANYSLLNSATAGVVGSSLVYRDGSGNFSANLITATLNGNAATASSVPGVGTTSVTNFGPAAVNHTDLIANPTMPAGGKWLIFFQWHSGISYSYIDAYVNGAPTGIRSYATENSNNTHYGVNLPFVVNGGDNVSLYNFSAYTVTFTGTIRGIRIG